MKVVYNACYGGFGLSEAAKTMLEEIKGTEIKGYKLERHDTDLVHVVETLGDKANGGFAKLRIEEIPDGADYEITENDGHESVQPPRMEWSDFTN